MGDRTTVTLDVLAEHAELAETFMDDGFIQKELVPPWTIFHFEEVNYGDLDFLDELQAAGIPYDSNWDSGDGYAPGTASLRFTSEGEAQTNQVYDHDNSLPIAPLVAMLDKPDALELIKAHLLEQQARITVLPWDNQIEYAKLYRAHMLIIT